MASVLDIQMPELDGLGVAGALAAVPNAPALVFVTAYDEDALAAFELAALDYLVKPVSLARLGASLARVQRLHVGAAPLAAASLAALEPLRREAPRRLAVRSGAKVHRVRSGACAGPGLEGPLRCSHNRQRRAGRGNTLEAKWRIRL